MPSGLARSFDSLRVFVVFRFSVSHWPKKNPLAWKGAGTGIGTGTGAGTRTVCVCVVGGLTH